MNRRQTLHRMQDWKTLFCVEFYKFIFETIV
jgi:hypothetical protein